MHLSAAESPWIAPPSASNAVAELGEPEENPQQVWGALGSNG